MRKQFDLSQLNWKLSGWSPNLWRNQLTEGHSSNPWADVRAVPARVPGSVQGALLEAGVIPDWNTGLRSRESEWVENRNWVYEAALPDEWLADGETIRLTCLGLDYSGWIAVNGKEIAEFVGSFVPHSFELTEHLRPAGNVLWIVFDCPPRWLGYCGATSRMTEWKPRFNYTWDWSPRLVQIGVWDSAYIEVSDGAGVEGLDCSTDVDPATGLGAVELSGSASGGTVLDISLERDSTIVRSERFDASQLASGITCRDIPVELWWPNLQGDQPLYTLRCRLLDAAGNEVDSVSRRVGFRSVTWQTCEGAPEGADPWICVVNSRPIFLQGVNWTPIRLTFADATEADYRKRLEAYRDMGVNMLRVWGGAVLEKECFYDLCDELGLLVWQEFSLCSAWMEDWPPEDPEIIEEVAARAESYIARRRHHASLAIWCSGNELQGSLDGARTGTGKPVDASHPLIRRLQQIVAKRDPGRRFLVTSASGPREFGDEKEFGEGLHWDVHGPWNSYGSNLTAWTDFWKRDDALFRSEVGHPGASSTELIRASLGGCPELPATMQSDYWTHPCPAWAQGERFAEQHGREPRDLEELVAWSQALQAEALAIAARSSKERFPGCGGIIIWMGHDSYPCPSNTSILDFNGDPKPATLALREVFRLG